MFRWVIGINLVIFFGLGSYFFYQKTQVKNIPKLVRNYVEFLNLGTKPNSELEITINFTGDVILGRSVNFLTTRSGDFTWSFKNIASDLRDADLTVINLESPLISDCPLTNEGFIFCGDKRNILGLSYAGVDIVGFSNNHSGDYGISGVLETVRNLDSAGILVSGTSERQIAYKKIANTQFAFLAFNSIGNEPGVLPAEEKLMINLLKEAQNNADFLIVQIHWGNEYTKELTDFQKTVGKFLIDNGADLVIGNHPHWIQDYEIYKGKYILYALGNFIFDQEWSQETKEGVIARVIIKDSAVARINFIPVEIRNYGQVFKTNNFAIIPNEIK
jgi:poly-gamma-glutamate capsule biosynthesis protein CapA/YwtB (metallophosphatase superfamily)